MLKGRVAELDLLRLAAAISVVAYHLLTFSSAHAVTRFGWLGVPLFFMISGFVILWTATTKDALGFVVSRAARLYPSFWAGALLTAIVVRADPATLLANLTMLPTYLGQPRLDGVYWTLEIEVMFYALVFGLIVTRQLQHIERYLAGWLVACLADVPVVTLGGWAPFFASGCYFFLVRSHGLSWPRALCLTVSAALCVDVAVSLQHDFTQRHTVAAKAHVTAVVIALHALLLGIATQLIRLPSARLWYRLGSLTYPIYLVHNEIGKRLAHWLGSPGWTTLLVVLLVVGAIAAAMAILIEQRACQVIQRSLSNWLPATQANVRLPK